MKRTLHPQEPRPVKNKNRITITSVRLTALLAIAACGGRAIGAQQWAVFVSMFWGSILSGAAGHTYGAAGIWHAGVEGDHGNWGAWNRQPYDWTTWKEGMAYPGSTQVGIGKRLLEQSPWHRLVPHPEWAPGCFAAGIPGEVRFIYQACRSIYNWDGTVVKRLERDVSYDVIYLDPATGRRFDQGIVMYAGPTAPPFAGHTKPMLFEDRFEVLDASAWKDYGTPTRRENARLVGGKGMVTVAAKISELDLMASVDANRDAEAGIILRFHDADNYLVALYSPLLKAIFLHDRKNGQWGEMLGRVDVPEVGPKIHLLAAACGECAALVLTDGKGLTTRQRSKSATSKRVKPACGCSRSGGGRNTKTLNCPRRHLLRWSWKPLAKYIARGRTNSERRTCRRRQIGCWCWSDRKRTEQRRLWISR